MKKRGQKLEGQDIQEAADYLKAHGVCAGIIASTMAGMVGKRRGELSTRLKSGLHARQV